MTTITLIHHVCTSPFSSQVAHLYYKEGKPSAPVFAWSRQEVKSLIARCPHILVLIKEGKAYHG